jgi:phage replication initiation protein
VLVDYLRVTFPAGSLALVLSLFAPGEEWQDKGHGMGWYAGCFYRGNVKVMFSGATEAMGVHVEVSGQGCRELEADGVLENDSPDFGLRGGWVGFLEDCFAHGGSLTRLDVAVDDRSGLLDIGRLRGAVDNGEIVSRFREVDSRSRTRISDGSKCGETVAFGVRGGNMFVRVYNKGLKEQITGHWVRCEVEARNEKANELARLLIDRGMPAVAGVLLHYIDVKQPRSVGGRICSDSNRRRWDTASWWSAFLGFAEKLRLGVAPCKKGLQDVASFVEKQVAPSLAALVAAPGYGRRWLESMLDDGAARIKPHHREMMAASAEDARRVVSSWCSLAAPKVIWLEGAAEYRGAPVSYNADGELEYVDEPEQYRDGSLVRSYSERFRMKGFSYG